MLIQRICDGLIFLTFALIVVCISQSEAANVNINFNGFIKPGSCEVDLDQPVLDLGDTDYFTLKTGNGILNIKNFNLNVHNCFLSASTILKPAIQIDGDGFNADGKFFFHGKDSTAKGIGVLLFNNNGNPQYSDQSLRPGDYIELGGVGQKPDDTVLPFYVGVSCGSVTDCASVEVTPGKMISRIIFNFRYY